MIRTPRSSHSERDCHPDQSARSSVATTNNSAPASSTICSKQPETMALLRASALVLAGYFWQAHPISSNKC
jgi:hypothetical protein